VNQPGADINIVGHTTHDLYDSEYVAGGCAFFGAHVYRALGADVRLLTVVGEDFECGSALDELDAEIHRAGRTTTFRNIYPEEGPRRQVIQDLAPMMDPQWYDEKTLSEASVLHLAPVLTEIELDRWTQSCKPDWCAIGVQGWIKRPAEADDSGRRPIVQKPWQPPIEALRRVDIACLSDEDLREQGDLLDRLVDHVSYVTVTHGADGATLYVDGTRRADIGVYPGVEPSDPTGAGDCFAAGFILALTQRGWAPAKAATLGAACASVVIEGRGSEPLAHVSRADQRISSIPVTRYD
jgi:sugar/nucleoside kinase (ribokinase family)